MKKDVIFYLSFLSFLLTLLRPRINPCTCFTLGRKELLDGMLGANLVCFQVRFYLYPLSLPFFLMLINRPTPTVATSSQPASVCAGMKPIHTGSM